MKYLAGSLLSLAGLALGGCGATFIGAQPTPPDAVPSAGVAAGWQAVPVDFGADNAQTPAFLHLTDGSWAMAYGSDKLGDRHLHFTTSPDGKSWSASSEVAAAGLSDQDPALMQDAAGHLCLVFSSNRNGSDWQLFETTLQQGSWTSPQVLGLPGAMQQAPAVARTPSGWALAYQSGDGLVVATSTDGHGWSPSGLVVPMLDAPAIAQIGSDLVVVAQSGFQLFELDRAAGGSWSSPRALQLGPSEVRQPALAASATGSALLAFASRSSDAGPWSLSLCSRTGKGWSAATTVAQGSYDDGNPALQLGPSGQAFLAWGIDRSDGSRGVFFATAPDAATASATPSGAGSNSTGHSS